MLVQWKILTMPSIKAHKETIKTRVSQLTHGLVYNCCTQRANFSFRLDFFYISVGQRICKEEQKRLIRLNRNCTRNANIDCIDKAIHKHTHTLHVPNSRYIWRKNICVVMQQHNLRTKNAKLNWWRKQTSNQQNERKKRLFCTVNMYLYTTSRVS